MTKLTILVLCSGNIGRSPLVEVLLEASPANGLSVGLADLQAGGVVVASAGTDALGGDSAAERGVALAAEMGLDLTGHRATPVSKAAVRDADLIYCMTTANSGQLPDCSPRQRPGQRGREERSPTRISVTTLSFAMSAAR